MSTDKFTEALTIAKGAAATAPRIWTADIEAAIESEHYFTAADGIRGAHLAPEFEGVVYRVPGAAKHVTICMLVLVNGTKVLGINEGPVSPEEFSPETGRFIARGKAVDQIYSFLGYELRSKLAQPTTSADTAAHDLAAAVLRGPIESFDSDLVVGKTRVRVTAEVLPGAQGWALDVDALSGAGG